MIWLQQNLTSVINTCRSIWNITPSSLLLLLPADLLHFFFISLPPRLPPDSRLRLTPSVSHSVFHLCIPVIIPVSFPTPYCSESTHFSPNRISYFLSFSFSMCRHVFHLLLHPRSLLHLVPPRSVHSIILIFHFPSIIYLCTPPPPPPSTFDPILPLLRPPLIRLFHTWPSCDSLAPQSCDTCPCV